MNIKYHPHFRDLQKMRSKKEIYADKLASIIGSWNFIAFQTSLISVWIFINIIGIYGFKMDPYPFILLNLLFSTQAAYAAPILQMAANRQTEIDHALTTLHYEETQELKQDVKEMQEKIQEMCDALHRSFNNKKSTSLSSEKIN